MKKRIGFIYNKPIIDGDINLKTNNEIHKSELYKSNSGESSSNNQYSYYKILTSGFWEISSSMEGLCCLSSIDQVLYSWNNYTLRSSMLIAYGNGYHEQAVAFRYCTSLPTTEDDGYNLDGRIFIDTYEFKGTLEERLAEALKMPIDEMTNILYEMITPITEEEYTSMIKNKI